MSLWKRELPSVKPYYAVKCNPEPKLIEWLSIGGAGFDCASGREIELTKRIAPLAPIVYANPCKKEDDILFSSIHKIKTTVVDSQEEIDKLYSIGWKGDALIRIRVDDTGSLMPFGNKFGASLSDISLFTHYAALKTIRLSGISFHVGSGCLDTRQYRNAIVNATKCIETMQTIQPIHQPILDIGGGFSSDSVSFRNAAHEIRGAMTTSPVKWIGEPGRFFASTSHDFFVRVIGKKPAWNGTNKRGWRYTIDDSLYGQFSCIPFDHATPKWIRIRDPKEPPRPLTRGVLFGRTCDSLDLIASAEEMEELEIGDWLWFPHMGAYTTVTATEFNGFPTPKRYFVEDHDTNQLPCPTSFRTECWPRGVQYVTPVKAPSLE